MNRTAITTSLAKTRFFELLARPAASASTAPDAAAGSAAPATPAATAGQSAPAAPSDQPASGTASAGADRQSPPAEEAPILKPSAAPTAPAVQPAAPPAVPAAKPAGQTAVQPIDPVAKPAVQPSAPAAKPAAKPAAPTAPAVQPATQPAVKPNVQPAAKPAAQAEAAAKVRSLWFVKVADDGAISLSKTERRLPASDAPLADALAALLAGPTAAEAKAGLSSLFPAGSVLLSATVRGSTAYLNFNDQFQFNSYGGEGSLAQLRQVVLTATEFPNVQDVQILIDGRSQEYLGESGIKIGGPLAKKDL